MEDLTKGSLTGHLLKTTSFMLVGMVFQTLYLLVDLFWVGRLGADAVAAVGIAGNFSFAVLAVSQMLGVGTTTLVSHASGRKERERAGYVFNQSQALSVVVGLLFFAGGMAIRRPYADALAADEETAALAIDYLNWYVPAMALQFAMAAMGAALRGTGNFRPGMIVQTATVVINMVLAPFLVFGWGTGIALGVVGAALSTFISIVVGSVWITTYFVSQDAYLHLRSSQWKPEWTLWGQMLKIGLPAGVEFLLMGVNLVAVYAIARPFGAAAQAGFGVGFRIVQSSFLPVVALSFAVAPVAGQNFGARRPGRVRQAFRAGATLAGGWMAAMGLVIFVFAASFVRVFTTDAEAVQVGVEYLRIVSVSFAFSGVTFVTSSMFQAMGNTMPSLITSTLRLLLFLGPGVLLSRVDGFELQWLWWLNVASVTAQLTINVLLVRREFQVRLPHLCPVDPAAFRRAPLPAA